MPLPADWLQPDWPAPASVRALVTSRQGGVSLPPYDQMNLAEHVGDDPVAVARNRVLLRQLADLPGEPVWLQQVHGVAILDADVSRSPEVAALADGSLTRQPGRVLAVLTADCLPVLFSRADGRMVMAVHAGWRGLADGILAEAMKAAEGGAQQWLAWIGPAIGVSAFEVGPEVRAAFMQAGRALPEHFVPGQGDRWCADLAGIARWQLQELGLSWVGGACWCSSADPQRWYSYRRDGVTGRMASLVWMTGEG